MKAIDFIAALLMISGISVLIGTFVYWVYYLNPYIGFGLLLFLSGLSIGVFKSMLTQKTVKKLTNK